jgi:hypothetical protein
MPAMRERALPQRSNPTISSQGEDVSDSTEISMTTMTTPAGSGDRRSILAQLSRHLTDVARILTRHARPSG